MDKVTGGYSVKRPVLQDVSFQVEKGQMVALIGLNGAGKSTTMKHILGILQAHQGTVRVGGVTLEEDAGKYRSTFAYVPETPILYDEMTVEEHLRFTAMAYGLDKGEAEPRMRELLDVFQMTPQKDKLPVQLSKGMKQKVMIMNAFLVRPKLYLIDEPFLGLDPLGIRSLVQMLVQVKEEGSSVLVSSHILPAIEPHCEQFVVLQQGKVLVSGDLKDVQQKAGMPDAGLEDAFLSLVTEGRAI
nr:ABC transporter ATP-binding protein [Paenibacillus turpanensis]